jgi:AraC-like DNA-binding protein
MWADVRFEGLAFEQVALAPGEERARMHDDYAFVVMRSGSGVINSGGAEYQTHLGSGFLFCPDQLWTARAGSDALCYQTLYISLNKLTTLAAQLELTSMQVARLTGVHVLDSETSEAALKAWAVFEARSSLLERVASLVELAAMVASACRLVQTVDDEPRVSRVRTFLQEHLSEHIEISRLAEIVSLSRCHFIRVFHRAVGVSLYRYVTLVRTRHAERLLRAGVPIAEAADSAGFYDQSHLSRYFRRILGVTPGQYQKARFLRARPVITCEKVMAYRLRSGEKLVLHWAKLRSARGYSSCPYPE